MNQSNESDGNNGKRVATVDASRDSSCGKKERSGIESKNRHESQLIRAILVCYGFEKKKKKKIESFGAEESRESRAYRMSET